MRRAALREARAVVALCLTITFVMAWIQWRPGYAGAMLQRVDLMVYDLRFNLMLPYVQREPAKQPIVIVDIDERSLKEIGQWPWDRKVIAQLIEKLSDYGAISVTFDVVFSEPERNMALEVARDAPVELANGLAGLAASFDYNQIMANTMSKVDVVLGYILQEDAYRVNNPPPSNIVMPAEAVTKTSASSYKGFTSNLPVLQAASRGVGYINGKPDIDGTVRRMPLFERLGEQLVPGLAMQTAMTYLLLDEVTPSFVSTANDVYIQGVQMGERFVRTDGGGRLLIPYIGRRGSFPYVPATDVLHDRVDRSVLAGSIVIVGPSAVGLSDLRTTPVGANYPGVESQATVIDALLRGDAPYQPDYAVGLNLVAIVVFGVLLACVMPLLGPGWMSLLGFGAMGLLLWLNFWAWRVHGLDLPVAAPLLMALSLYVVNLTFGFLSTAQQKDQIKGMFGQYVAPAHIDRLLGDPASLSFNGESKTMTVLFSDIRGFTTISEKLTANELKDVLNRYLTPMTEVIFDQAGTIDKYVGDMIMAFWGAPLDDPNQQEHAVMCAILMQRRLALLREEFRKDGYPDVHAGIGLNTGLMNVGDMGSSYRRAYTVLGDAVNLGSRLESITKFYGVGCLVSETTKTGIEEKFLFREIDNIIVKGKKEPIKVYEPLETPDAVTDEMQRLVDDYAIARQHFLARQWDEAASLFSRLLERDSSSAKLYKLYLERIRHYRQEALPDDWAGVWEHTEK